MDIFSGCFLSNFICIAASWSSVTKLICSILYKKYFWNTACTPAPFSPFNPISSKISWNSSCPLRPLRNTYAHRFNTVSKIASISSSCSVRVPRSWNVSGFAPVDVMMRKASAKRASACSRKRSLCSPKRVWLID